MTKPTLLILAAGLGSRYGSLKQIDSIGPSGERIIDYSVYDAVKAGFGKIVYVIRENFEEEFKDVILDSLPSEIETDYVCQELHYIPEDIEYSREREKPWGTGHALMIAAPKISEPFAVINADDFYGYESFKIAADYLSNKNGNNNDIDEYALIGFRLRNTLSEFGSVSRGVCKVNEQNYMTSIVEIKEIKIENNGFVYKDDNGEWQSLTGDENVSMNMFAFKTSVFEKFEKHFREFLKENNGNLKSEFYIPTTVDALINNGEVKVKVLESNASWFGLTYAEDKPIARDKMKKLIDKGLYPPRLWSGFKID
ncbi:MAG: nucleotidyltransferase [Chlorobi bacterium]|nr:nucleotidyltransferase [Chlorobiota bacterium]